MRSAPAEPAKAHAKRVEPAEAGIKAHLSASPPPEPGTLLVRFDGDAGRFVQTLTDANSEETIWRFPSETQLAYSRAVMAYLRALAQR